MSHQRKSALRMGIDNFDYNPHHLPQQNQRSISVSQLINLPFLNISNSNSSNLLKSSHINKIHRNYLPHNHHHHNNNNPDTFNPNLLHQNPPKYSNYPNSFPIANYFHNPQQHQQSQNAIPLNSNNTYNNLFYQNNNTNNNNNNNNIILQNPNNSLQKHTSLPQNSSNFSSINLSNYNHAPNIALPPQNNFYNNSNKNSCPSNINQLVSNNLNPNSPFSNINHNLLPIHLNNVPKITSIPTNNLNAPSNNNNNTNISLPYNLEFDSQENTRSLSINYPFENLSHLHSQLKPQSSDIKISFQDEINFPKHILSDGSIPFFPAPKRQKFDKRYLSISTKSSYNHLDSNTNSSNSASINSHPCNIKTLLLGPPLTSIDPSISSSSTTVNSAVKRKPSKANLPHFIDDKRSFKKNKFHSLEYSDATVFDDVVDLDSVNIYNQHNHLSINHLQNLNNIHNLCQRQNNSHPLNTNLNLNLPPNSQQTIVSSPYLLHDNDSLKSLSNFESDQLLSDNLLANLETESTCVNLSKYCHLHPKLNKRMRAILVDWLMEVANDYKLHRHTLHLSIYLLDKLLLSKSHVPTNMLQCYGAACLLVSIKAEENRSVKISEITRIAMGAFSTSDLKSAEIDVLNAANWHLTVPTIATFIGIYTTSNHKLYEAACDIADIVVHDYDFVGIKYSNLAIACCQIAASASNFRASAAQSLYNTIPAIPSINSAISSLVSDIHALLNSLGLDLHKLAAGRQLVECPNYDYWSYQPYHPSLLNMFQQFFKKKANGYSNHPPPPPRNIN
ncbi:G1/S-specific cyclin-E [Smittium culicis]|uniref:G1/S-specific cyclin-E n=1 Tax=Smittium culicis TaxID=133412 RepID=A0A1R1X8C8_9FUNG|nr:G1/S-specific cyclin-E [Smittium culicis]